MSATNVEVRVHRINAYLAAQFTKEPNMLLEELPAIRETQTKRPVSLVNDFGLHLALSQDRERARRRLFWEGYFIGLVGLLLGLVGLLVTFVLFIFKAPIDTYLMNFWDDLAFIVAAMAIVYCASSMTMSRRKHEQEQSVFAPSLRREIERGIAQIDFEIATDSGWSAWRNAAFTGLATILGSWEFCRLTGDPRPWDVIWVVGGIVVAIFAALVPVSRLSVKQGQRRKRVLEGLLAKLDENSAGSWNVAALPNSAGEPHILASPKEKPLW
jgi:hypothetical protein